MTERDHTLIHKHSDGLHENNEPYHIRNPHLILIDMPGFECYNHGENQERMIDHPLLPKLVETNVKCAHISQSCAMLSLPLSPQSMLTWGSADFTGFLSWSKQY